MKRIAVFLLALVMCISLFSGCVGNNSQQGSGKTSQPPSKGATITYPLADSSDFTIWTQSRSSTMVDPNEYPGIKNIEKLTGVHIEWKVAATGQAQEALTLIIASQNYPDAFQMDFKIPGGVDKNINDDVIIALNDIIEQNAPDYWALLNSTEINRKDSRTDTGNIGAFILAFFKPQPSWLGPVARKDYLDKTGLDIPQTYDEWHTMLVGFRDLGLTAPLMLASTGVHAFSSAYITGYDVTNSFFQIDGTVKFGPIEQGYRDYLEMLNQWYAEGLIDSDFFGKTDLIPETQYIVNDYAGVWHDIYTLLELRKEQSGNPDYDLVPLPLPTKGKGDALHLGFDGWESVLAGGYNYVTTACKDPELFARWTNVVYTEAGMLAANYGIEGESFELVNGQAQFTELVTKNPDGMSLSDAMLYYTTQPLFPKIYRWDRERFGLSDLCLSAPDIWASKQDGAYRLPSYDFTTEESSDYSAIMGDINTLISEMSIKFITGMSSFNDYDNFVNQIRSMNIDAAIKLVQTATDRYKNR